MLLHLRLPRLTHKTFQPKDEFMHMPSQRGRTRCGCVKDAIHESTSSALSTIDGIVSSSIALGSVALRTALKKPLYDSISLSLWSPSREDLVAFRISGRSVGLMVV